MKTLKSLIVVAATLVLLLATDGAFAQPGRGNLGARIRNRAQARLGGANEAVPEIPAADAVPEAAEPPRSLGSTRAPAQAADQARTQAPAQAAPQAQPQAPAQNGDQEPAKEPLKKSDGSEFVIPKDATPKELIEKASSLLSTEVAFETEEEYDSWIDKMLKTVSKIADTIFQAKGLEDADFIEAISLKGQALCYQASLKPEYLQQLGAYADLLAKNKRVQSLEDGRAAALAFKGVYLQAKVAEIAENNGTVEALTAAMDEVAKFVAQNPETSDLTVDLVYPVAVVAANQNDPELPEKIWTPIRKQLAASDDGVVKNALQMLEGTIRYSQLEGAPFEWKGCDVDGKPLDVERVKGRVVVVDFWASWCQPSPEMHAQLRELYKKYRDQGLEIVGYNLDAQTKDMKDYMEKNELPWINLSDRATVNAKETSLAAYYGIAEIPTMILIGGDGNVAALDVSMESLIATLDSVFEKAGAQQQRAKADASASKAPSAESSDAPAATGKTTLKNSSSSARKSSSSSSKAASSKSGATGRKSK